MMLTHRALAAFVTMALVGGSGCAEDEARPLPAVPDAPADRRAPALCEAYQLDTQPIAEDPRVQRRAPGGGLQSSGPGGPVAWTTQSDCHLATSGGHSGRSLGCPTLPGASSLDPIAGELPEPGRDEPAGPITVSDGRATWIAGVVGGTLVVGTVDALGRTALTEVEPATPGLTYELVIVDGQTWLYAVDPETGTRQYRVCLVRDS